MTFESLIKGYFVGYFLTVLLFLWLTYRANKSKRPEVQSRMRELSEGGPMLAAVVLIGFCAIWPYHLYLMLTRKKEKPNDIQR